MKTEDILEGIVYLTLIIVLIVFVVAVIFVFFAIQSAILMLAWNYVMPYAFGLPKFGFLHALCLIVIAKIILPSITNHGTKKPKD